MRFLVGSLILNWSVGVLFGMLICIVFDEFFNNLLDCVLVGKYEILCFY